MQGCCNLHDMVDYTSLTDECILSICNSVVSRAWPLGLAGALLIASSTRETNDHDNSATDWLAASFVKEEFSTIGSIPYGLVTMHHALQGKRMHVQPQRFNAV